MKRSIIHGVFALLSLGLLALVLWQGYLLRENRQLIAAVAAVPASIESADIDEYSSASAQPEVLLATARGLFAGGQAEAAEAVLVRLIDQQQFRAPAQAARFNLANHYVREGTSTGLHGAQARPLLEIAKQRYRDLLRADPQDWPARYNLEYVLRYAPEQPEGDDKRGPPPKSVRVIVPDFVAEDLP